MHVIDPYNIHEYIEDRILAIASKYARNGRIDLDKCLIVSGNGETIKISHEDCELLRRLYQADKELNKVIE